MNANEYEKVHFRTITAQEAGQRLDHYLRKHYPNLPKSRIYQMLRQGEVRRNKGRVKADYKIQAGDVIRIPPIQDGQRAPRQVPEYWQEALRQAVVYEDDDVLVINKPAGLAVHGGSAQEYGVIDVVEALWGQHYASLVHRLDRDTSGLLMLAKHRQALVYLQDLIKNHAIEKHYACLVHGDFRREGRYCLPLLKVTAEDGERMVVHPEGKEAITTFRLQKRFKNASLLAVQIETGRTHQIRVSLQHLGYGIVGDDKYGKRDLNKAWKRFGLRTMFLHAQRLILTLPNGSTLALFAPFNASQNHLLQHLEDIHD